MKREIKNKSFNFQIKSLNLPELCSRGRNLRKLVIVFYILIKTSYAIKN